MVEPDKASQSAEDTFEQSSLHVETSEAHWEVLGQHLEDFLGQWEANGLGPPLSDHLPSGPPALRRMVLIELVKVDLEYRHSSDGPVLTLEDYIVENPELTEPDGLPAELIHEEYHVRKSSGQSVSVDEFLDRFPDRAQSIQRVFQIEETTTDADAAAELDALEVGDHIGDFYLMSKLGAGAFGSVFLARQESMQRMVALKISGDKGTEGQTLAQLDHPNIVRVYDQVRLTEQNLRLLYMQFAAGGTLHSVVKASRKAQQKTGRIVMECIAEALDHTGVLSADNIPLKGGLADRPWPEVVCQLGMELALALQYAHSRNTLHRDVKPANVLLDANGTAKLADFNISFAAEVAGDDAAASFGGSLAYMSPEQMEACHPAHDRSPSDLDGRSDIYSLGVLLWELLTGDRPFDDEETATGWSNTLDTMIATRERGVEETCDRRSSATEQRLKEILFRCLHCSRDQRYRSAGDLARDLGLCLQPRVAQLMQQRSTPWQSWALKKPLAAFLLAAIGPHMFAAVFNFAYNDLAIKHATELGEFSEKAFEAFQVMVLGVNAVAFPVGFYFCIRFGRPVTNSIRNLSARNLSEESAAGIRQRMFRLSRFVTVLGISEWLIAGMIYPLGLRLQIGQLDPHWYLHFFWSLLICGLIAAAYPFFFTSTLTLRAFLPQLLQHHRLNEKDVSELHRLSDQSAWSLYLAGGVPAVGTMILLMTQEADNPVTAFPLLVLSVAAAVGFAFALKLARTLQTDVEAFTEVHKLQPEAVRD